MPAKPGSAEEAKANATKTALLAFSAYLLVQAEKNAAWVSKATAISIEPRLVVDEDPSISSSADEVSARGPVSASEQSREAASPNIAVLEPIGEDAAGSPAVPNYSSELEA